MIFDKNSAKTVQSDTVQPTAQEIDVKLLQAQLDELRLKYQESTQKVSDLEKIIAQLPGNIYWKDKTGVYKLCNDQFARILHLSHRNEIQGKTDQELLQPYYADIINNNDSRVLATGEMSTLEECGYDDQGKPAVYITKKSPIYDEQNNITGLFGLSIDITERKNIEKELQIAKSKAEIASQAKSEFIYNMSHDLRTPFSGILGFAYRLYDNETNEDKKTEINYIIKSAEKLLALINEILLLTEDGNNQRLLQSEFDLISVIHDCRDFFSAEIARKSLSFVVDCAQKEYIIHADKHRIYRILINLISNALKFTLAGRISIKVDTIVKENQTYVQIQVIDTGIGIPQNQLDIIFDKFTRLESAYKNQQVGTGNGLWFTKKFTEDLSGTISVQSQEKVGSNFIVTIPVSTILRQPDVNSTDINPDMIGTHTPHATLTPTPIINTKRVLIVEDDDISQQIQSLILRDLNCDVEIASDGDVAVEKARMAPFDLILMDIGLPKISGFEAAKRIKNTCLANQHTPIVGLTAHISQNQQIHKSTPYMTPILIKPLTRATCIKLLASLEENS